MYSAKHICRSNISNQISRNKNNTPRMIYLFHFPEYSWPKAKHVSVQNETTVEYQSTGKTGVEFIWSNLTIVFLTTIFFVICCVVKKFEFTWNACSSCIQKPLWKLSQIKEQTLSWKFLRLQAVNLFFHACRNTIKYVTAFSGYES